MARRSTSPIAIAHVVADGLAADDIHGTFTVGEIVRDGGPWHFYRAQFDTEWSLDAIPQLAVPFAEWLERYYSGFSQLLIEILLLNDDGEVVEHNWRSLTRTHHVNATLEAQYIEDKALE